MVPTLRSWHKKGNDVQGWALLKTPNYSILAGKLIFEMPVPKLLNLTKPFYGLASYQIYNFRKAYGIGKMVAHFDIIPAFLERKFNFRRGHSKKKF